MLREDSYPAAEVVSRRLMGSMRDEDATVELAVTQSALVLLFKARRSL